MDGRGWVNTGGRGWINTGGIRGKVAAEVVAEAVAAIVWFIGSRKSAKRH